MEQERIHLRAKYELEESKRKQEVAQALNEAQIEFSVLQSLMGEENVDLLQANKSIEVDVPGAITANQYLFGKFEDVFGNFTKFDKMEGETIDKCTPLKSPNLGCHRIENPGLCDFDDGTGLTTNILFEQRRNFHFKIQLVYLN